MELTPEQLQLRLQLLKAMDDTNDVLEEGLLNLRQAYEVMNYFERNSGRREPMRYLAGNMWNGLYLSAVHRITDLFDDDNNVVSIRRVLGLIYENAKQIAAFTNLDKRDIKKRVDADRDWLKMVQISKALVPFVIYRNKVSAHRDSRGLPKGTKGRGYTTGAGKLLLIAAFDLLNRWRSDLGLPVVVHPLPEESADTKVFFHALDTGLEACFGQDVVRGWEYGEQDWRGAWMEPAVPMPHDYFDAYEAAPSEPSAEAASGSA